MSDYTQCGVCNKQEHYWKCAKIGSGEDACPTCFMDLTYNVGTNATYEEYTKYKLEQKEHNNLMNNYINNLKRYGTYLNDKDFISRIIDFERELCENLLRKDRRVIVGTTEELLLIATIQCWLIREFPDITEEELKDMPTELFNHNHSRYYNII